MEEVARQLSLLNENNVTITRRLDRIDQGFVDINRRLDNLERTRTGNEYRVSNHDEIISEIRNIRAEMNRHKAQNQWSTESQDPREGGDERTHSITNKRILSLERAMDEKNKHLRAIDHKIASLRNQRNSSSVNVAFDNAPGDVIALREIAPTQRG